MKKSPKCHGAFSKTPRPSVMSHITTDKPTHFSPIEIEDRIQQSIGASIRRNLAKEIAVNHTNKG